MVKWTRGAFPKPLPCQLAVIEDSHGSLSGWCTHARQQVGSTCKLAQRGMSILGHMAPSALLRQTSAGNLTVRAEHPDYC
eukprot:3917363-Amphidinium_carterae.1